MQRGLLQLSVGVEAAIIMCKRTLEKLYQTFAQLLLIFRNIKAQYPYHTIHQHHTQKIPEVQIVKVPVVQEVKVLQPYKVPYKIRVPYVIKQEIHTVPVYKKPVHTSQHIHHAPTKHHAHESSHGFSHYAASNDAPMVASHTAVGPQPLHDMLAAFTQQQWKPQDIQMISSKSSHPSRLNTLVQASSVGFGSHEGQMMNGYEVKEPAENFEQKEFGHARVGKSVPFPYPFSLQQTDFGRAEAEYGFSPSEPSIYNIESLIN